jgi:hypothetical protein
MGFDDDVDALKQELQNSKLDPAGRRDATIRLCQKLKGSIESKRIEFSVDPDEDEPFVAIRHTQTNEQLAAVFVNEDGSITFQSSMPEDEALEDEDQEGDYFPPYVEYFDESEFLEDAPEILKLGLAEYELDLENAAD